MRVALGRVVGAVLCVGVLVVLGAALWLLPRVADPEHVVVLGGVVLPVLYVLAPLAGLNLGWWLRPRAGGAPTPDWARSVPLWEAPAPRDP